MRFNRDVICINYNLTFYCSQRKIVKICRNYLKNLQINRHEKGLFGCLNETESLEKKNSFDFCIFCNEINRFQIGGGLWGGCLSTITGIIGTIAMARRLCPLRNDTQRITHTIYLALSLICVAVSQLVLVLAATGLARDLSKGDLVEIDDEVRINIYLFARCS